MEEKEPKQINHLLNVDMYHGSSEKSLKPFALFLTFTVILLPVWYNLYFLLNYRIPAKTCLIILAFLFLVYEIRIGLFFLGDERKRVERYRQQLYRKYEPDSEIVNIPNIDDDGLIHYLNGNVAYMVICLNGNVVSHSKFHAISKFLEAISNYNFDVLVQNIVKIDTLDSFYTGVKKIKDKEIARDFLELLEFNKQYVTDNSLVVRTVFVVHTRPQYAKELRSTLEDNLPTKAYYKVNIASRDEAVEILNHDTTIHLDLERMLEDRFHTGSYFKSKVVGFDKNDSEEQVSRTRNERRDFIPRKDVR